MSDADTERVDALIREAARAAHPTRSQYNVLMSRAATLERKVAFLAKKLDILVAALDPEDDAAHGDA